MCLQIRLYSSKLRNAIQQDIFFRALYLGILTTISHGYERTRSCSLKKKQSDIFERKENNQYDRKENRYVDQEAGSPTKKKRKQKT